MTREYEPTRRAAQSGRAGNIELEIGGKWVTMPVRWRAWSEYLMPVPRLEHFRETLRREAEKVLARRRKMGDGGHVFRKGYCLKCRTPEATWKRFENPPVCQG